MYHMMYKEKTFFVRFAFVWSSFCIAMFWGCSCCFFLLCFSSFCFLLVIFCYLGFFLFEGSRLFCFCFFPTKAVLCLSVSVCLCLSGCLCLSIITHTSTHARTHIRFDLLLYEIQRYINSIHYNYYYYYYYYFPPYLSYNFPIKRHRTINFVPRFTQSQYLAVTLMTDSDCEKTKLYC